MKVIIFDVSNGSCALVIDDNGNSIMIDCGGHGEKDCPVELIKTWHTSSDWMKGGLKHYSVGESFYPLTKLIITHPDNDHIKNIAKVTTHLPPLTVERIHLENYLENEIENDSPALAYYQKFDANYRGDISHYQIDWNLWHKTYCIDPKIIRETFTNKSIKNNSSLVTLCIENGVIILFGGDMEQEGWRYLIENNINGFADDIKMYGVDIFIAPHHGHHSGYSPELFKIMTPRMTILSKGMEEGARDDSDVSPNYSINSKGDLEIRKAMDGTILGKRSSLSTRKDGNIFIETKPSDIIIHTSKGHPIL